jgi:ankyrin repeat protein
MRNIFDAIVDNNREEVEQFIRNGQLNNRNENMQTPLMVAIRFIRRDIALFILTQEATSIISRDAYGRNALMYALLLPQSEIASTLINAMTIEDLNSPDSNGVSPLIYAIESRSPEMILRLLEKGVDMNTFSGAVAKTPLMQAIELGDTPTAQILIRNGANVALQDNDGNTALHYAAAYDPEVVPLLLEYHADVNHVNRYGESPIDYAWGNLELLNIMNMYRREE